MLYEEYIQTAIEELLNPAFEVTKQYLEVCELELENGLPKVVRVNTTYYDKYDTVAVYFAVKNERYFIEVRLNKAPDIEVIFVWVQSGYRVYLSAQSNQLTYQELTAYFPLEPSRGWSKGDFRSNGKSQYSLTKMSFEPIRNEAYPLNEKLDLLLDVLEPIGNAIRLLTQKAEVYIAVCRHQYVSANSGVSFDIKTIRRMEQLNLGIDIDSYIIGTPIKSDYLEEKK
jgi:hypothetical protein